MILEGTKITFGTQIYMCTYICMVIESWDSLEKQECAFSKKKKKKKTMNFEICTEHKMKIFILCQNFVFQLFVYFGINCKY